MNTPEIVLSGSLCAGKTKGLRYLAEKLEKAGVRVFDVAELATRLFMYAIRDISRIEAEDTSQYLAIHSKMLEMHLNAKREYSELARIFPAERKVILYDLGAMNLSGYMKPGHFEAIVKDHNQKLATLRDSYHTVIHLATAAHGFERAFYATLRKNPARQQSTAEEGRKTDLRAFEAWRGHPDLRVVNSRRNFDHKLRRLYEEVARVVGLPVPKEKVNRYLLKERPNFKALSVPVNAIAMDVTHLFGPNGERLLIAKRSFGNMVENLAVRYFRVRQFEPNIETQDLITPEQYIELVKYQDSLTYPARKIRRYFLFQGQYVWIDSYMQPVELHILGIERTEEKFPTEAFGPIATIEKEITDDLSYSEREIASIKLHGGHHAS